MTPQHRAAIAQAVQALRRAEAWIAGEMLDKGWPDERIKNPPEGSHLHAIDAALSALSAILAEPETTHQTTKQLMWSDLTDEDRQAAFESLPDMLDGFLKTWGWLHFANAIEARVKMRNAHLLPPAPKLRREKMTSKAAGGYARAAVLSPERRREIAIKANAARWAEPRVEALPERQRSNGINPVSVGAGAKEPKP